MIGVNKIDKYIRDGFQIPLLTHEYVKYECQHFSYYYTQVHIRNSAFRFEIIL